MNPVDLLRKAGGLSWRYKERMVLALALVFLGIQVYKVLFGEEESLNLATHPRPAEEFPGSDEVSQPPVIEDIELDDDYSSIYTKNMFSIYSSAVKKTSTGEEDYGIKLLGIVEWRDGTYRAEIKTTAKRRRKEGEAFESFELRSINPDAGTVEVYSEKHGRLLTLPIEEE